MLHDPNIPLGYERTLDELHANWTTCPECLEEFRGHVPLCDCYETSLYKSEKTLKEMKPKYVIYLLVQEYISTDFGMELRTSLVKRGHASTEKGALRAIAKMKKRNGDEEEFTYLKVY